MHKYEWDKETGGLLLTTDELKMSKEPRPVYSQELDILGFDKYWQYPKSNNVPLMWAEGNNYIYRGRLVAQTKGGSAFLAPEIIIVEEPELSGDSLRPVDIEAMVRKNAELMEEWENETIKKIENIYTRYKNKVDVFYVAFSGGKDSILVLDLVQRAIPHNMVKVLFGDTQMEFPDTYKAIEEIRNFYSDTGIEFLTAKSSLSPLYTWNKFGPPAQRIRWCCSVHKSTPQILLLRKHFGNANFKGMAFTGIRAAESANRSEYDDVSFGEKVRGQYSCHPILEWNTAELYLYTYMHHLVINDAYKKGNSRAGCLVCPLAGHKNMWIKEQCYSFAKAGQSLSTTTFDDIILSTSSKYFPDESSKIDFMNIAGWKARRSGRELSIAEIRMTESYDKNVLTLSIPAYRQDWKEWLKTVGRYSYVDTDTIRLEWEGNLYTINIKASSEKQEFRICVGNSKSEILLKKALKIVMRKSAYCISCRVCEANCPYGYISMDDSEVHINDKCIKCGKCHDIDNGCLVASSLKLPIKESNMGSINRYTNLGVEFEWVKQFFKLKVEDRNSAGMKELLPLGSKMIDNLRTFLNDSGILDNRQFSRFGCIVEQMGIDSIDAWALILCNLAYTPQFNWWIKNIEFNSDYTPDQIKDRIKNESEKKSHVISAFKNILISNNSLSEGVGLGVCAYTVKKDKKYLENVQRLPWKSPNPDIILYSLYKFAEACGDYKQFTLTRLMDTSVDSDGVSPIQIFGLDRETMKRILNGLSVSRPDFINASFTLDLDNITLRDGKTSEDVLNLFNQ